MSHYHEPPRGEFYERWQRELRRKTAEEERTRVQRLFEVRAINLEEKVGLDVKAMSSCVGERKNGD